MSRPSPQRLFAEAAELALHLHWSLDEILDLEHADRHRVLQDVRGLRAGAPRG